MKCRHAAWCPLLLGIDGRASLRRCDGQTRGWLVAALIALEDAAVGTVATWATAAVLLALAIALLAIPGSVPGLVIPGGADGGMHAVGGAMR
jgi:hypothetical protein